MKVAVTGGSGFLGSFVASGLAAEGHHVRILDVVPPRFENQASFDADLVTSELEDLEDVNSIRQCIVGCDVVMHLAAVSNTRKAIEEPDLTMWVNSLATQNVFEAAREAGVRRVVVAGSSLVSGALMTDRMTYEEDEIVTEEALFDLSLVKHPYVMSKIHAEMIANVYAQQYGIESTVFRYGIQYGRGMTPGVVVHSFVKNALAEKPLIVDGTGEQWRQYTHVWDVAEAHLALIREDVMSDETRGVFNIVGNDRVTINDLAEAVSAYTGATIEHGPSRDDDIEVKMLSNAKAQKILGWAPSVSLSEGIKDTIDWYRKRPDG